MDNKTKESVKNFFKRAPGDSYFRFLIDEKHPLTDPNRANGREDPFALSLINRSLSEYYFPRGELEAQIRQWCNQIITGRRASGKTTLRRKVADPVPAPENKPAGEAGGQQTQAEAAGEGGEHPVDLADLVVTVPLHRSDELVADEAFLKDRSLSPLSISILPRYIMSEFFTRFIFNPAEQAGLLGDYRKKLDWMEALCWAYNNFPPLKPTSAAEFELMAWLSQYDTLRQRVTWPRTDQEKLAHLISLVTSPVESVTGKPLRRFRRVVVLVDETEDLPHQAVERLLKDFARLVDTGFDNLCVKLFVDRRDLGLVEQLEPVRQGLVVLTEMPKWEEQDLKKLLLIRPLICTGQTPGKNWDEIELGDIENSISYDWTWSLVPHVLQKERGELLNRLIAAARRVYPDGEDYDAPYHALRLTRGVLWYASTLAAKDSGPKELEMKSVDEICDLYWSGR